MFATTWRRRIGWLSLACLVACAGCGKRISQNESVEGTVKIDGTPLVGVMVQFVPVGEQRLPGSTAITDEQGHFVLKCENQKSGALVGKHYVTVASGRGADSAARRDDPQGAAPAGGDAAPRPSKRNPPIPDVYTLALKTPLVIEITPDEHTYDLKLSRSAQARK